jgi:hypothetical protein
MTRLIHSAAYVAAALVIVVMAHPVPDASGTGSWGSSLAMRDPDPGFWRAHPGAMAESEQTYSVGMSSLAAMTRIAVAPGDDLRLTNLGASGALMLESGALVLTEAEGPVFVQRSGKVAGFRAEPASDGTMLMRGDRILFQASATVAFSNPEATAASLLLATEIPQLPSLETSMNAASHAPSDGQRGPDRPSY